MTSPPCILAIDIGAGTQDILLYQPHREEENNPQLVIPSPSRVWGLRLERLTGDLFIHGDTIGGGRIGSVLRRHIEAGDRVACDVVGKILALVVCVESDASFGIGRVFTWRSRCGNGISMPPSRNAL